MAKLLHREVKDFGTASKNCVLTFVPPIGFLHMIWGS